MAHSQSTSWPCCSSALCHMPCLPQVDAWALGCLAAELVTGSPPFEADSKSATYQLIMYREPRLASLLSQAARSFIAASLAKVWKRLEGLLIKVTCNKSVLACFDGFTCYPGACINPCNGLTECYRVHEPTHARG